MAALNYLGDRQPERITVVIEHETVLDLVRYGPYVVSKGWHPGGTSG
jgi:hypothetical protein